MMRFIGLVLLALYFMFPGDAPAEFQMAFLTAAIVLGAVGLGATGASIFAAGQSSDPSFSSSDRASIRRPLAGSLEEQLRVQSLLQIGATPDDIIEDLAFRRLEATSFSGGARVAQGRLQQAKALLLSGDEERARRALSEANRFLATGTSRGGGAPVQFQIQDGQIVAVSDDPTFREVRELAEIVGDVGEQRARTLANIARAGADFPTFTQEDIRREFDREQALLDEQDIERSNLLGTNPAIALAESRKRGTAQSVALGLLRSRQELAEGGIRGSLTALAPTLSDPALTAAQLLSSNINTAQQTGAGLSIAAAEAEAARNAGIATGLSSFGGQLLDLSTLGLLASGKLQGKLGKTNSPTGTTG